MGRRKGSKNKVNTSNVKKGSNTTKKNASSKSFSNDMLGGLLVFTGLVLLVFLMFDNIGVLPEAIKSLMKGLFGFSVYIFPITLVMVGIYSIMSEKKVVVSNEIKKGLLIMMLFSATLYSFTTSDVSGFFNNVIKSFVDSYNLSVTGSNIGGVAGTLITSILASFTGIIVTRLIFSCITFIAILCTFNISFKEFFVIVNNICVGFCNIVISALKILFRDDEIEDENDNLNNQIDINDAMKEQANVNASDNVKVDRSEQLVFDINKLGIEPSKEEVEGKQKRDEFFKLQREQKEDKSMKEVLTLSHTNHVEYDNYEFPSIDLLNMPKVSEVFDRKAIEKVALKLQKTLASFGVEAKVTNITKGPTVTRYELTPSTGVKVSKIVNLSDDIALNLAAKSIRIEAPIPGRAAVGIEVPNAVCESVYLREVIESDTFKQHKSKLAFALGKDAAGDIVVSDIAKMPHMLIAGATGSGKSVCINSLIISLLYKSKPSEVKMMLIDPKMVELSGYNGIPHLLIPVVTDAKKAAGALNWAVQEMVNRYTLFASKNVKDIKGYNKIMEKEAGVKLPQIVIIVDELADLMMVAPNDVEDAICRLAQMARAAGMHLVIATQRPSVDVITGIIKANIPSRIACTVSSQIDSRTILDMAGAEKLLGKGDMLYFPVGQTKPLRVQGTFISEEEIESIVEDIKSNSDEFEYSDEIIKSIETANLKTKGLNNNKAPDTAEVEETEDPILNDAIDLAMDMGQASASMFQRKFKIGYSRAGRIIDQMEERGLISGYDGSKPRKLLISKEEWQELKFGTNTTTEQSFEDTSSSVTDEILNDTIEVMEKNNDYPSTHSKIDVEL